MAFQKKYLFFDWDGTMIGHSRVLNKENVAAIGRLREKGHKVFLCSGRSPAYLMSVTEGIMEVDGVIGCAGGALYMDGEYFFENGIEQTLLEETNRMFAEHSFFYNYETKDRVYFSPEGGELMGRLFSAFFKAEENADPEKEKERQKNVANSPDDRSMEEFDGSRTKVQKMTFVSENVAEFPALKAYLEQHYFLNIFVQNDAFIMGEIIPRNCTKEDGIRRLLEKEGISWEDTLGFGDSMNDLQMLSVVGTPVVWDGAEEILKEKAKYFFIDPDRGGIARVLEEIGLI